MAGITEDPIGALRSGKPPKNKKSSDPITGAVDPKTGDYVGTTWSADPTKWTPEQQAEFQQGMGVLATPGVLGGLGYEATHGKALSELPPGGVLGVGQGSPKNPDGGAGGGGKGKTTTKPTTATPTTSPWEQLAGSLVGSYQTAESALNALAAGGAGQAAAENGKMAAGAEAMLGQGAGGPAAQYFAAQSQAAQNQAQGAGLYGAEAQVAKDEQAASALEQTGLKGLGVAEAAQAQGAPYQQLLSSMASEVPYHLAQGYTGQLPGLAKLPGFLQQAEVATGTIAPPSSDKSGNVGDPNAAAQSLIAAPAPTQTAGANNSQTG